MVVNNVAIEIEGMDKTGKDTLAKYLGLMANYAYTINVRGILTQLVYNDKFGRNNMYALPYRPFIVFLDVDNVDHAVRCVAAGEPKININKDREVYYKYIKKFKELGITVLTYNTSEMTPYMIAKDVIEQLSKIDINDYVMDKPLYFNSLNSYTSEELKNEDVFYKFDPTEEN